MNKCLLIALLVLGKWLGVLASIIIYASHQVSCLSSSHPCEAKRLYFINTALKIKLLRQRGEMTYFCMFHYNFKFKEFILFLSLLDSSCQVLSVFSWMKASISTTAALVQGTE